MIDDSDYIFALEVDRVVYLLRSKGNTPRFVIMTIEMSLPKYQFKLSDAIKEEKVSKTEVQRLKKWMPTVDLPNVSNEMIASFIIACERDLESAKKTMLTYFRIKRSTPEFFENRDIDRNDLRSIMNTIQFGSMPVRTDDDYSVHLSRIVDSRYSNFQVDPASKLYLMLNDITLNSGTPPRGVILMTDMKGFGLMHLSKLKLKSLRTLAEFVQGGMPLKVKEIHLMNASYVTEKFIFMLKPFIRPEVFGKINIHRSNINMADFHEKYIPKKCLPIEYGGDLPSFDELNQKTIERLEDLREFFKGEEQIIKKWNLQMNQT